MMRLNFTSIAILFHLYLLIWISNLGFTNAEDNIVGGAMNTVVGYKTGSKTYVMGYIFEYLNGLYIDLSGNIYIGDAAKSCIYKIYTNGTMDTLKNGEDVINADNIYGITGDTSGNIYFSEMYLNRIQKLDTNITLTTIAGKNSDASCNNLDYTSDFLCSPYGIFYHEQTHALYIADSQDHRIRLVDLHTNTVSTVVGSGQSGSCNNNCPTVQADLNFPHDIWVNSIGDIFIADTARCQIKKVDNAGKNISTYAGMSTCGNATINLVANTTTILYPTSITGDRFGNIYFMQLNSYSIQYNSYTGGYFISSDHILHPLLATDHYKTVANNIPAIMLDVSIDVKLRCDHNGTLYVLDASEPRLWKIQQPYLPNATVSLIVGRIVPGVNVEAYAVNVGYVGGMYPGLHDDMYVSDMDNNYIYRVSNLTSPSPILSVYAGTNMGGYNGDNLMATSTELLNPYGIVVSSLGHIFFIDSGFHLIRRIDKYSSKISTIAGKHNNNTVSSAYYYGPASKASFGIMHSITIDSAENLYFFDEGRYIIRMINMTNMFISTIAGNDIPGFSNGPTATQSSLWAADTLWINTLGVLYFSDSVAFVVRMVNLSSNSISTFAGVVDNNDPSGGYAAATELTINTPYGICGDTLGNMFISARFDMHIFKVDTSGFATVYAGNWDEVNFGEGDHSLLSAVRNPYGCIVDTMGTLYFHEYDNYRNRIRAVDKNRLSYSQLQSLPGTVETIIGPTITSMKDEYFNDNSYLNATAYMLLESPSGIFKDSMGNVFIAKSVLGAIHKINVDGMISIYAGGGNKIDEHISAYETNMENVKYITGDTNGNIYYSDTYRNRVRRIGIDRTVTTIAGKSSDSSQMCTATGTDNTDTLCHPQGIFYHDMSVYIVDSGNYRIRAVNVMNINDISTMAGDMSFSYPIHNNDALASGIGYPQDIWVTTSGDIYITDVYNCLILLFDSFNNVILIYAGGTSCGDSNNGASAMNNNIREPISITGDSEGNILETVKGIFIFSKLIVMFIMSIILQIKYLCYLKIGKIYQIYLLHQYPSHHYNSIIYLDYI
jgi:hypothetical protein